MVPTFNPELNCFAITSVQSLVGGGEALHVEGVYVGPRGVDHLLPHDGVQVGDQPRPHSNLVGTNPLPGGGFCRTCFIIPP